MRSWLRRNVAWRLMGYLAPYTWAALVGIIMVIISVALQLLLPFAFGTILLDNVLIGGRDLHLLNIFALGTLVLYALKGLFHYVQSYLLAYASQRLVYDLRNDVFQHLQNLSLRFYESNRTGETIARVTNDITLVQAGISTGLGEFVHSSLMLLGIIVSIFFVHWRLALLTLITIPLVGLTVNIYGGRIRHFTSQLQERVADISAQLQETLTGIRIVKAFTMEEDERRRFDGKNEQTFRAGMKSAQTMAVLIPVVELLMVSGIVLVLWYGAQEVVAGRLTTGLLTTFITLLAMVTAPLNGFTRSISQLEQSLAAGERVFLLLDEEVEVQEVHRPRELRSVKGRVEYENVSFAYNANEPVLQDINLIVEPGEVVALVGPSGAGKSTMVNLLPRFYDPTAGRLCIDGIDIRQLSLRFLRSHIGLVPQETILFGVSVAENIRYGRPSATREEVIEAARTANAHEFITHLTHGYDTLVGERGTLLSGGQKQRVAIARAILRDPRILILDEATSSLDTESEGLVQEALERLMKNRTTFVIAHRLSTVMHAGRILVLDNGRIVEAGRHSELLELNGVYRRLYDAQFRGELI